MGPGISAILDDVKRRRESILVPRPRQALDGAQYGGTQPTDISRINRRSYWSRSCPAASSARDKAVTKVAPSNPAAGADRCWGGGLDGASHTVTQSQVAKSIKTRRVCLARESLDKLKSYQRRGPTVCANGLVVPLDTMERAVIDAFEPLLTPSFVEATVQKIVTRPSMSDAALDLERETIRGQIADVRRQVANLIEGLAQTGASREVTKAIRDRESRQAHLEQELSNLDRREKVCSSELQRAEALARQRVSDWRGVLRRQTPKARQILAKLLRERLVFVSERRAGRPGYRFNAQASIVGLLSGTVSELSVLAGDSGVPNG